MATTKKTTIIESDSEQVTDVQPVHVVQQPVAQQGMSRQNIVTLAIVSGVALFFLGLGLGYLLGHITNADRNGMMQNNRMRGGINQRYDDRYNGGMMNRRGYNQDQPNTPNSTQTTPQTQAN